jgi:membrane protein YdbS with pleckstrin-like domain
MSFITLHLVWVIPVLWGAVLLWLFHAPVWDDINLGIESGMATLIWGTGLVLCGIVASLLFVRWRIMLGYAAIIGMGLILGWYGDVLDAARVYLPAYTITLFVTGLPLVEMYRRSHRYFLTNLRVVLRGGILRVKERCLRYEKITDIDASQGILGKIFGFGTIIPITHSGFGMGDDASFAALGAETTPKKRLGFFGFVGGSRSVNTPRARSYYELHGVCPYGEIRTLLENMVQQNTLAPYQREQIDIQREILKALRDGKE